MKLLILAMLVQTPTLLQQLQVKHPLSKHRYARCTLSSVIQHPLSKLSLNHVAKSSHLSDAL